jgi:ABC-type oligopeptide transport system ATPase subunit
MISSSNDPEIVLEVKQLKKYFPIRKGFLRRLVGHVKAVDDISFHIRQGETLSLVGEVVVARLPRRAVFCVP